MLSGDQEFIFTEPTTQVAAPATDQTALEEYLAPANYIVFKLSHRLLFE
jgi:hypothetical protein